jgi:N-acetylmuramic acid 6-phosphate etherase
MAHNETQEGLNWYGSSFGRNRLPVTGRQSAKGLKGSGEPLLEALVAGQRRAIECVAAEADALEAAAKRVAAALRAGGRLVYLGAGSSGLLAMQDGLELPGTFSLGEERIRFVAPNGERFVIDTSSEDDEEAAATAIDALALGPDDIVIAVSASGATPFTVAGAKRAKENRATVAAIVCRLGSPLASVADVAAVFDIGPEAVEGSTRLAAGTAQKAALSIISTLAAAELGHVHDGLMVNVRPENAKLKVRARRIVERLASVGGETAEAALIEAGGDVATAVAAAAGSLGAAAARRLLKECGGDLAEALSRLRAQERKSTRVRA